MRIGIALIVITLCVLVVISDSKSTKKASKKSKDHETKALKKSHPAPKQHDSKKAIPNHKRTSKKVAEKKSKIAKPKTVQKVKSVKKDKPSNKGKAKLENDKKAIKVVVKDKGKQKSDKPTKVAENPAAKPKDNLKQIPSNCDEIVEQYANGQMVMYEYKIKMAKCLKAKDAALKSTIVSKYEDDSSINFFKHAMKYVDDDGDVKDDKSDDNDDDESDKKSIVPATYYMPAATYAATASYYPRQGQVTYEQPQNIQQAQASFAQGGMANQAAPMQQDYNYYTRSNVAAAPQTQQWYTPNMGATKKDTFPAAPADDPFASFMNIQSSQKALPQAAQPQMRSGIPAPLQAPQQLQQRSEIPIDASYQAPAAPAYSDVPSNQQAFFRAQFRAWSPEEMGNFPESP